MNIMLILVRLPGIPQDLWNELSFKELGNAMGYFMDMNFSFRDMGKMLVSRILVSLDVRAGLAVELVLIKGSLFSPVVGLQRNPFI
jgi:hypothetical protein